MTTLGASTAIDSCVAMINQKAWKHYERIPNEHKRWIDPEDIIQEGMLEAVIASQGAVVFTCGCVAAVPEDGEAVLCAAHQSPVKRTAIRHIAGRGKKFSTFLYLGLDLHFQHILTPLVQQKRVGRVVELDAPLHSGDDGNVSSLANQFVDAGALEQVQGGAVAWAAVDALATVVRALTPEAAVYLVVGLLLRRRSFRGMKRITNEDLLIAEIGRCTRKYKISFTDLAELTKNEETRKMALTRVVTESNMGLGGEMEARVLECVSCTGQLPLKAIPEGRYVVETSTCMSCYRKLQAQAAEISCFGKAQVVVSGAVVTEGYSETDIECQRHCKDRHLCRTLVKKEKDGNNIMKTKQVTADVEENEIDPNVLDDADFGDVADSSEEGDDAGAEEEAEAPVVKKKKKVVKEETPVKAKAAKSVTKATADEDVPKEVGDFWPHKRNSTMQSNFKWAYQGVKASKLQKLVEDVGGSWKLMLQILRRGWAGNKYHTHEWKLNEEGGMLKIYDVKFLGARPGREASAPTAKEKAVKSAEKETTKAKVKATEKVVEEVTTPKKKKKTSTSTTAAATPVKKKKKKVATA